MFLIANSSNFTGAWELRLIDHFTFTAVAVKTS